MRHVRRISIIDQTIEHIREGIREGCWTEKLPGLRPLAEELGVSRESLRTALRRLEADGVLASGDQGDSRRILGKPASSRRETMRIAILPARRMETESVADQSLILRLMHDLEAAGYDCTLVSPHGHAPGVAAVTRLVAEKNADVWMIYQGSLEVLKWFSEQPVTSLAIGGHHHTLPVAAIGFDYDTAVREVVGKLVGLGHRRIVFISPDFARRPTPALPVKTFLASLAAAGLRAGEYNSPEWEEVSGGPSHAAGFAFQTHPAHGDNHLGRLRGLRRAGLPRRTETLRSSATSRSSPSPATARSPGRTRASGSPTASRIRRHSSAIVSVGRMRRPPGRPGSKRNFSPPNSSPATPSARHPRNDAALGPDRQDTRKTPTFRSAFFKPGDKAETSPQDRRAGYFTTPAPSPVLVWKMVGLWPNLSS